MAWRRGVRAKRPEYVAMEVKINEFDIGTMIRLDYNALRVSRIALNLYNAAGEILLHFNPRYDDNVLVLNSFIGGCWGLEERLSGYSLNPGTKADSETTHAEISDGT